MYNTERSSLLCKLFGHKYFYHYLWHDGLKRNIETRTCIRCGFDDSDYYWHEWGMLEAEKCLSCGAYVCISGICSYCED